MSLQTTSGDPVHYPKRRDLFQFDDEVASIFDNMAPRSIPMYKEVHRLHVSLFSHLFTPGCVIADIGSSTGHLFRTIEKRYGKPLPVLGITGVALDVSRPMMARLRSEFPYVLNIVSDLSYAPELHVPVDIMFALYTLQFVSPERKEEALAWMIRNVKVGGVLVLGQKEVIPNTEMNGMFSEEYYHFRRDNGYTQEEIDAKTEALKGSMFPVTPDELRSMLRAHGMDVFETSRWLQFSTIACIRRK